MGPPTSHAARSPPRVVERPEPGGLCVRPSAAAAPSSRLQPAAPAPGPRAPPPPTCRGLRGAEHPVGHTQGV